LEMRRRKAFQHSGRFNSAHWPWLDSIDCGEQFSSHHASRNALPPEDFEKLIADTEQHLRSFGRDILNGVADVAPFRKGTETACDRCEFHSVCRFDPWTQPFRSLKPAPKASAKAKGKS
jgi:ATP-dependent helicase/nuclease subunit B